MDLHTITSWRAAHTRDDLRLAAGERVLAGGTWLFSTPQHELTGLVDLTALGWQPWTVDADGLSVSATCTIAELLALTAPPEWASAPLFRQCAESFLMSFKIWNTATIGGNLCLALPAGAMISLAAALDADVVIWRPDGTQRRQLVTELVLGVGETTLQAGEVIRSVEFSASSLRARTAFRRASLTSMGRSAAIVIGRLDDDGRLTLSVTAATPRPYVFRFGTPPTDDELQHLFASVQGWYDDPHGASDWRAAISLELAYAVCEELRA